MFKPFAAAILSLPVLWVLPMHAQDDLTLDQVIQKHTDAQGGADKLKALTTVKATGNASLMGGQIEAPITMVMKRPNSMRMEMTVQGQSFVQAFDGTTSWTINPFMGSPEPQKSSEEDAATAREDSDFIDGPLFDYKSKGNTVELLGKEDVDGSPAYKIKVTKKSGNVSYIYLDAKTFLDIRSRNSVPTRALGPADARAGRSHTRPDHSETHRRPGRRRQAQSHHVRQSDGQRVPDGRPNGSPGHHGYEATQLHAHGTDRARPKFRSGLRWRHRMVDQPVHGFARSAEVQ